MKISIIGAGNIGGTLGSKWAAQGHEIHFGVRDPQAGKVQSLLVEIGGQATAAAIPDAIAGARVVLFAIPGRAMPATVRQLGDRLDGKILIDATNNVGEEPMHSLSALRRAAPNAALFRAFSNLGWENFASPIFKGMRADLFYCGDSGEAQAAVDALIADVGLRPVYIGETEKAVLVDNLTRLWFTLALEQGRGRHLALKLLTD
ncbi:MAG: NAD(P)-binding domain-containing protein [Candidatus Promineifilaceae bacterium]|nr:NAD(P)-binding domain-containing protein [Candidatus Promineifilaceae bacterium]